MIVHMRVESAIRQFIYTKLINGKWGSDLCLCQCINQTVEDIKARHTPLYWKRKKVVGRRMEKEKEVPYQTNTRTQWHNEVWLLEMLLQFVSSIFALLFLGSFPQLRPCIILVTFSFNMYDHIFLVTEMLFSHYFLDFWKWKNSTSLKLCLDIVVFMFCDTRVYLDFVGNDPLLCHLACASSCIATSNRVHSTFCLTSSHCSSSLWSLQRHILAD